MTVRMTESDAEGAVLGWFEEFTRGDMEGMISGVNRFLGEHLG